MTFSRSLFLAVAALSTACTPDAKSNQIQESYYKDLLFNNNSTGMTYYANYIVPFYYFDGECISVTSQNEGDRAKRLAQYHKLNVELLNVDNKNNVDHELRNLLSDVSAEVPRSYARVRGIPEGRRKRGSGNILCPSSSVERNKLLNDGGIIEYKLIRNRKIFE